MLKNYQDDFSSFEGRVWFNTASEGPLPKVAVAALNEAVEWKTKPFLLTNRRFQEVPQQLKSAIGKLLNLPAQDIILGNSATYGIHLLANGIPFKKGDEILLMQNDFPTDILPWLSLKDRGVIVRQIPSKSPVLTPEELAANITKATKLVCLPHVHTFSGHVVDIEAIGKICKSNKIIFVANVSQSVGYMPLDFSRLPVDAITCAGFKWLLGPYGTGFAWVTPSLREKLVYDQAFWANIMSAKDLESTGELTLPRSNSASRYDVFGTANFFNFRPLTASIEYLLSIGLGEIQKHNDDLVKQFIAGLKTAKFALLSDPKKRSALVFFTHKNRTKNPDIFHNLIAKKVYGAFWKGNIRIAPHIFNTREDIERFITILNSA